MSNYFGLSREDLIEKILMLVNNWESLEKSVFIQERLLPLLTWEQLRDIYMSQDLYHH